MKKEIKKVPTIRFQGFTEDWEQRKLSELLYLSNEKNDGSYTRDDVLAASLGTELQKKHIYFGLRATDESVKKYKVVLPKDVIYTKSPIKGFPNGIIRTNKGKTGIVPTLYCVYHSIDTINPSIIQAYFESKERLDAYLVPLVNIGARNNVNITDKEFINGSICIPKNKTEQNRIVDLLEKISNLITLHQRKFDELKTAKTFFLQNMFPAKGEKVPRIRFHGFTGDWEQRKLNELSMLTSSKRIHAKDYVKTGIPFFRGAEISKLGEHDVLNNLLYISELTYNGIKKRFGVPKVNDILVTAVGTLGNVFLVNNNKPFYFKDGNLIWLRDIQEDARYIYTFLKSPIGQKKVLSTAEGSNQKALTMIKLGEILIPYPNRKEQKMIGNYFKNLDHLITLHQRKLDQLKTLKKFMLQNLFI